MSRAQWIALYSIAGFLIFTVMMSSQKRRAERNALLARWNSQDAENPERVALPSGFIPNFGERVLYSSEADCWLPKAVSVSTGQIRGIAFGMLGAAETSSESVDKNLTKHVGIGILVVTNRRIIVCAGNDVAQWPIGSVVTTEILDTRRELHSQWPARLVMRIANAGIATFSVSYVPALRDSLRLSITGEA